MGFLNTPEYMELIEKTPTLSELNYEDYDALVDRKNELATMDNERKQATEEREIP
jgi:hypothetical protein